MGAGNVMVVVVDIIDIFIVVDVLIWVCWVDIRIEVGIVLLWLLIIILWLIILLIMLIILIVVIIVIHLIITPSRSHPLPNNLKRVSCCRWYWVVAINIVTTTDAIIRTLPKYPLSLSLLLFSFFLFLLSNLLPIDLSHLLQLLLLYSKRHHRHYLLDQIFHGHYLMLLQIS